MPDNNIERVGKITEVVAAVAAIGYRLVTMISGYLARRRQAQARQVEEATAIVEARLPAMGAFQRGLNEIWFVSFADARQTIEA